MSMNSHHLINYKNQWKNISTTTIPKEYKAEVKS